MANPNTDKDNPNNIVYKSNPIPAKEIGPKINGVEITNPSNIDIIPGFIKKESGV